MIKYPHIKSRTAFSPTLLSRKRTLASILTEEETIEPNMKRPRSMSAPETLHIEINFELEIATKHTKELTLNPTLVTKERAKEQIQFLSQELNIFHQNRLAVLPLKTKEFVYKYPEFEKDPFVYFQSILDVPSTSTSPNTFVLGDADGSVGRMFVIALQSGHITLSKEGHKQLASILHKEYTLIACPVYDDHFKALNNMNLSEKYSCPLFQKDHQLSDMLSLLMTEATFHKSPFELIFIGDILHDRLSCNKSVTIELVQKLHENGAIFIWGNHDQTSAITRACSFSSDRIGITEQYGANCADHGFKPQPSAIDPHENVLGQWEDFEKTCFVVAHYDERTKLFSIHNGIKIEERDGKKYLTTAFHDVLDNVDVKYFLNNPQQLVLFLNNVFQKSSMAKRYLGLRFVNFRPKEKDIQIALKTLFPDIEGIQILHGHDGSFSTETPHPEVPDVYNINTDKQGLRRPVSLAFEFDL